MSGSTVAHFGPVSDFCNIAANKRNTVVAAIGTGCPKVFATDKNRLKIKHQDGKAESNLQKSPKERRTFY